MNAGTIRLSRITNASARRHAINTDGIETGVIETRAIMLRAIKLRRNSGNSAQPCNSSKPSSRGPRRSRIPPISRAINRCAARAVVRGQPTARQRLGINRRIAIAAAGHSKRRHD